MNIRPEKTKITVKVKKKKIGQFEVTTFPTTINTDWGDFTFEKSDHYNQEELPLNLNVVYTNYDYITQIYRKQLSIDFEKKISDFINIGLISENTPFAKKILNEVIAVYNAEWENDKELVAYKTTHFIDERLGSVQDLLKDADRNIQEFKDKYNLTEVEADVTFYLQLNSELQAQILQAETQLNIIGIIADFVKDEKNKHSLIPYSLSLADENMSAILTKYNEALLKRHELSKANSQSSLARSMDEQIEMQRQNLLVSLSNIKKGAQVTVDNLKRKEKEITTKIGKVPVIEKDYVQLRREQELQQTIYVFLLEMREETAVRGISLLPKLQIIDPPYVINKPISPSLMKTGLMIIFIGGILLPISAIYLKPYIIRRKKEK